MATTHPHESEGPRARLLATMPVAEHRRQLAGVSTSILEEARAPSGTAAARTLMPALGLHPIPEEELARIAAPTSLIWGRADRQVRLRVAEAAAARHGWPLHVIDGAAGGPAIERPKGVLRAP